MYKVHDYISVGGVDFYDFPVTF